MKFNLSTFLATNAIGSCLALSAFAQDVTVVMASKELGPRPTSRWRRPCSGS